MVAPGTVARVWFINVEIEKREGVTTPLEVDNFSVVAFVK